jgi:two-component system response regulator FixJ
MTDLERVGELMTPLSSWRLIQVNAEVAGIWDNFSLALTAFRGTRRAMTSQRVVHIVDDDAAVRRALVRLLKSAGLTAIAYETAHQVLDAAASLTSGCILLDVQMPRMGGLELLARLSELGIGLPVIVVTGHGDVPTAVRAMKAGAVDFIEKPIDEAQLFAAIGAALAEEKSAARDLAAARATEQMALLSPRERQVLEAIAVGRPNKLIAYDLGISVRTVEVHRAHLMDRLGVRNIAEAIRIAVMAALAEPAS